MEDPSYSSLKSSLSSVPLKALNFSSRLILSNNLDYKHTLPSKNNFARDYRGLGELMGFQYSIIKRFGESENPTMKILESWEIQPDATLDKLISYLEEMDRHDVITELIPLLEKNVHTYMQHQRSLESPIQVPEVTSGPMNSLSERRVFTRDDMRSGECTIYDAYVSYADEDLGIVAEFSKLLESPNVGLKLFIRGRDMLAGCAELDTNIALIKDRCRRMLILLTPNFIKSPALEFQVSFAGSLAIEQKQRILIPVILASCEMPLILNSVSKIDFTKDHIQDWMWEKLITSLMPEENRAVFCSPSASNLPLSDKSRSMITNSGYCASAASMPVITYPQSGKYSLSNSDNSDVPATTANNLPLSDKNKNMIANSGYCASAASMPVITFPQSGKHSLSCSPDNSEVLAIASGTTSEFEEKDSAECIEVKYSSECIELKDSVASTKAKDFAAFIKRKNSGETKDTFAYTEIKDTAVLAPKTSPSSKKFPSFRLFWKKKGNSNPSSSASFSSGATSGFHSQSYSDIRSFENPEENFPEDISL